MTTALTLTHLGHSCVLLEVPTASGTARILLDPGSLAPPLSEIPGLDAILVTHAHPDHITAEQVRAVRGLGSAPVYGDPDVVAAATAAGIDDVHLLTPGTHTIAGVEVEASAWPHEPIYPGMPMPGNLGLHIAGTVFATGDAFPPLDHDVDVLLVPTGAPWMKLAETIDYLRATAPRVAIPVHDGGLAAPHQQMHRGLMTKFAPEGTTVLTPGIGEPVVIERAA